MVDQEHAEGTRDALGRFLPGYKSPCAWKKGQSGNPSGGGKSITSIIKDIYRSNPDLALLTAEALILEAITSGKAEWMRTLLDRHDGALSTVLVDQSEQKTIIMVAPEGAKLPAARVGDEGEGERNG